MQNNAKFITLESDAYYQMITEIINIAREIFKSETKAEWISEKETMAILGISSKSTLQKFRDEDKIIFSMVTSKTIRYCRRSILKYLEDKANKR